VLTVVLCSETKPATVEFLKKCPQPDKAGLTPHYLNHASELLPFVAACGDPHVRLPDLEAEEFAPNEREIVFVEDLEEEAVAPDGEERELGEELEEEAAATADAQP
jgi:hypothetical protein